MPSAAEHQAKAAHNRAFLNTITDPTYCDWMAVVAFYVAVHLVERLFALQGRHNQDHRGRNRAVRRQLRPIHRNYRALYNLSMVARYMEASKFNLTAAVVRTTVIDLHLAEIEKYVVAAAAAPILPHPPGPASSSGS